MEYSLEQIRGRMIRNVARHRSTLARIQPDVMSDDLVNAEIVAVGRRNIHVITENTAPGCVKAYSPSEVLEMI